MGVCKSVDSLQLHTINFLRKAYMIEESTSTSEKKEEVIVPEKVEQKEEKKEELGAHTPWAAVGYILPVLFFIPMLSDDGKKSEFAMFHANQQLILLIASIVLNVLVSVSPPFIKFLLWPLGVMFLLIASILGLVNALKGRNRELPLIGGFRLLD
jgi:uncharacterized membrane protein